MDFTVLKRAEMEALRCRCLGLNNRKTAEKLFVSENAIKNRMTYVYRKLLNEDKRVPRRSDGKIGSLCFKLGYQIGLSDGKNEILDKIDAHILKKRR